MRYMIKLIVFDLDNTLAKIGKGIEREDIECLKKIEASGVSIAICSGKPVNYLCGFMRQAGLENPILLGENGAVIQLGVDLPPKKYVKLTYSEQAKKSIFYIRSKIDEKIADIFYQPNEVGLTPFPKSEAECEIIENLLEEHKECLVDVEIYRHIDSFDIVPVGIDKSRGMASLCELLQIDREETIAVGDGVNDYPMFAFSGCAIGVGVKDLQKVDVNFSDITQALEYILSKIG